MEEPKNKVAGLGENFTPEQFELMVIYQDDKLNKQYKKYLEAKYKLLTADVKDQYAERIQKDVAEPKKAESTW